MSFLSRWQVLRGIDKRSGGREDPKEINYDSKDEGIGSREFKAGGMR